MDDISKDGIYGCHLWMVSMDLASACWKMFSRGIIIIIIMVFLVAAASGKSHYPTVLLVTFTGTKKRRPKHFMLWEKHLVEHQIWHLLVGKCFLGDL